MTDANRLPFDSLYRNGFARMAIAVPRVLVADPAANVEHILRMPRQAADDRALLTEFPELALSAYTQARHDSTHSSNSVRSQRASARRNA